MRGWHWGHRLLLVATLGCAGAAGAAAAERERPADVVLTGEISGDDHRSYRELPFQVPDGVDRISVAFTYQRTPGTTIDLGLADPQRFRGWSGGNKDRFTLAETDATPSYLPGPLPAGEWHLVLGVPGIRPDGAAGYRAEIRFQRGAHAFTQPFAEAALVPAPGWYRGDLHLHSGHSDGACTTQSGARGPCPLYRTVQAAAARGLDFVAVTEHNTRSHFQGLRELQIAFDRLVLIPGRELTTFYGHANVLGTTGPLDFLASAEQLGAVLAEAERIGGLVSINHPALPSDERCLGCGWTNEVGPARVHAIEVVNGAVVAGAGGRVKHDFSGLAWWQRLLDTGARVTGVAGSDNHDPTLAPDRPGSVGSPVTVVQAAALSQPALLDAIRRGRAFVDVQGSPDRLLDLTAVSPAGTTVMGGTLPAAAGDAVRINVTAAEVPDGKVVLLLDGQQVEARSQQVRGRRLEAEFQVTSDGAPSWLRAEVVAPTGEPLLLSNPIYLNAH